MRTPLKVESMFTAEELTKAFKYVTLGGLPLTQAKAKEVIERHGLPNRVPSVGYELVLQHTDHEQSSIINNGKDGPVLRIWTSVNAPWLRTK